MDTAVIGYGVIGKATSVALGIRKHYDAVKERSNATLEEIAHSRYIFICIPTPTVDGQCDISEIISLLKQLEEFATNPIYVIRSTVTPGTAEKLSYMFNMDRVVSNPEFLTQDQWENDIKSPDLVVVGGSNRDYVNEVIGLYKARYKGVNIFQTDSITAEIIKYSINCFFSTKVVFANAIYDICRKFNANYETVKNAMYSNRNIAKNHLTVWFKGRRGVHGKCLPKDLEAFANWSNDNFIKSVLEAANAIPQEDN